MSSDQNTAQPAHTPGRRPPSRRPPQVLRVLAIPCFAHLLASQALFDIGAVARTAQSTIVYTDENLSYLGVCRPHDWVNHRDFEYVRGDVHTNGIESFWAMLKGGYLGTYHRMSVKHLHPYINEFAVRHNLREHDTIVQMMILALNLVGKRLRYQDLIADPPVEQRSIFPEFD